MVFVTSQPVHPFVLEYYFQFLAGIPASHARARLTLLCAYDASPRSLTEKILERPRLLQRIRDGIEDTQRAYLTVFNSTPLERRLAVLLDIPLNGVDPNLIHLGTKSGSRKVFREAGVDLPLGTEDVRTEHDVVNALLDLKARRPALAAGGGQAQRQLLGRGQRDLPLPAETTSDALEDELRAPGVRRAHRDPGPLLREARTDGRHRGGVHRGAGEVLAQRAAPHQPARRGARRSPPTTRSWAAPAARSSWAASSPPTRAYRMRMQDAGDQDRDACSPATAWSAASAWTSWPGAPARRRSGRSPRSRSTCAWAAPRIPTWPCSS